MIHTYTKNIEVSVKPSDVYRDKNIESAIVRALEEGNKRIIAFRPPVSGEVYIGRFAAAVCTCITGENWDPKDPRFIVEALPVIKKAPLRLPEWE